MFRAINKNKSIALLCKIHARQNRVSRLSYSSAVAAQSLSHSVNYKAGDQLGGYSVTDVQEVPEMAMTAVTLRHKKTGAEHLHLARDDQNNCFSVTLRTTPENSSGVAHILEHLALCGSEKYPCRDPFMKMTNRSLATFMNAMTWPDATMYPFSSINQKDYENLMKVYLDAVFFPKLDYYDFRQEGWRLEHETVSDKESPITFKGVVFNEMKGAFSSSSMLYSRYLLNKLFPSTTYRNESGGDPLDIPNLSYEYLKNFYAKHYHPSNSKFYTYGNFPLESTLKMIEEQVLTRFENDSTIREKSNVPLQQPWVKPVTAKLNCAPDPFAPFPDKQTTASVSFLLNDISDSKECFVLSLISFLLCVGPNSPFYQKLVASGIGMDYSPDTGMNEYTKQNSFSVGLQGIHESDVDKVMTLIDETFSEAANSGFSAERVEAVLHLIELTTKHQSQNFGLKLLYGLNPRMNHDVDAVQSLQVNKHISYLRTSLAENPNFLKDKIRKYFIENKHRLTLIMSPSETYLSELKAKEKNLLEDRVQALSEAEREKIYREGLELAERQKKHDDTAVLPIIDVRKDISLVAPRTELEHVKVNGVPLQLSPQNTNEICYFRTIFNFANLPQHLQPYLPLFSEVITKLGAGKLNHLEMDQEIQLRTKGLAAVVHVAEDPDHFDNFEKGLHFWSCSLERNFEQMLTLWSDIFTSINFNQDPAHLQQLIKIASTEFADSIAHSRHFATRRAAHSINEAAMFREETGGLSLAHSLKSMAEQDDVSGIVQKLEEIRAIVFNRDNMRCAFNGEPKFIGGVMPSFERFVSSLPSAGKLSPPSLSDRPMSPASVVKEHHVLPFSANHVGKAVPCVPFGHDDFAALRLAGSLMSSKFLLREVREIGGAYGAGAGITEGGIFVNWSYRDPNTLATLERFDKAAQFAAAGDFSEQFVDEAKISTFQQVDKPVVPEHKGLDEFERHRTFEMQQKHRTGLLKTNKDDIVRVTRKYLIDNPKVGIAVIGPENEDIKKEINWHRIGSN
ncbi:Presequence protease, mitochondrial [Halotydeus destructor]|nr:Presequence protease, mitochondrial [Halotydeus destructor]